MALVVENGDGLANADAYVTVQEARSYITDNYPDEIIPALDATVEAAIRRATRFIDSFSFVGYPTNGRTQSLAWPRTNVYDVRQDRISINEVPREVRRATCEAVIRELRAPGSLQPDFVASDRVVREKVGPIETQYANSSSNRPDVPAINVYLRGLTSGAGVMSQFVQRA